MATPHSRKTVALLALISSVSAISPVVAMPFVSRSGGELGLTNIVTGQALGTLGATAIMFGWNLRGAVSLASEEDPFRVFWESNLSRAMNALVVLPLLVLLASLTTVNGSVALTTSAAIVFAMQGFSMYWYAVGMGKPMLALYFDSLPRAIGNLAGGVVAFLTSSPILYVLILGFCTMVPIAAFVLVLRSRVRSPGAPIKEIAKRLYKAQWKTASTSMLLTVNETAPVTVLGMASSPITVAFAPFDRVLKYGYIAVYMVSGSMQGWVSSATGQLKGARTKMALTFHLVLAILLGLSFFALAPWFTPVFLGSEFGIAHDISALGGLALAAMCVSSGLGMCVLLPLGHDREYLRAVWFAAFSIVPAVLVGSNMFGFVGAVGGVAFAQVLSVCTMWIGWVRIKAREHF